MELPDYYARLGVERSATQEDIRRAYRKLARKYHPDVSKEPNAEAQFKAVAQAYQTLKDPDQRASYDAGGKREQSGTDTHESAAAPAGWDTDLFEAIFRQQAADASGGDLHAKLQINLQDAYRGTRRSFSLRAPQRDASGRVSAQERQLDVSIPKGVREGQHLRLAGQGGPGFGSSPPGDLYLEIHFAPHPHFRVDGRDVYVDVPIAPWEAVLGASINIPTPDGSVQLKIPLGSASGRKLRLKGRGLPSVTPGDLYAVLSIALPPADSELAKQSYLEMSKTFGDFNPRRNLEV